MASERAEYVASRVLAKCAAYDHRFPRPNEATKKAWGEHIELKNAQLDDMLEAVTRWYAEPRDRVPLPADISMIARDLRRERQARETTEEREAREARADAKAEGFEPVDLDTPQLGNRGRKITMAEWEELHGEKFPVLALPSLDEESSDQRRAALKIKCRYCKQMPGCPCVNHDGKPLTKTVAHDSRIREAEGRCAPSVGFHVSPHVDDCPMAMSFAR